ncbi:hypothetical protein ACWEPC_43670 [Nonomuraea sp. NPDC004297]
MSPAASIDEALQRCRRSALHLEMRDGYMLDDPEVTVELVSGHLTVTRPHEVGRYAGVFAELAGLALYGKAARALITRAIAALDE